MMFDSRTRTYLWGSRTQPLVLTWASMLPAPIAADSSARRGPTTLSRTFPGHGSSANLSSAVSSTNTSEPHRSPGQDEWPSSGTPQAIPRRTTVTDSSRPLTSTTK
jgi:hypothetical protein